MESTVLSPMNSNCFFSFSILIPSFAKKVILNYHYSAEFVIKVYRLYFFNFPPFVRLFFLIIMLVLSPFLLIFFVVLCSLRTFSFSFSCWMSSANNLIWIFVAFVVVVEVVSKHKLN